MTRDVTRRRLLAGGAAAALTSLAGCSGVTPFVGKRTEFDRTLTLDGATTLSVDALVGDVSVVGEDREDVALHGVKQASSVGVDLSKLRLEVRRDGDRLDVRGSYDGEEPLFGGTPTMDLSLRVPRSVALERVETTIGGVDVRDVVGDVTVESGTGDVSLRDVDGTVAARSSTGDVSLRRVRAVGDVSASTGDLDLRVPAIDGDARFESSTGDVVAALSPGLDADLVARANTGDVSVEGLPLSVANAAEDYGSESVTGTLGDGGPRLVVKTGTGDVSLSALRGGN